MLLLPISHICVFISAIVFQICSGYVLTFCMVTKGKLTDAQEEAAMLRRALNESMRRVANLSSEGNVQVDRRIVVKLLVTFFEKGQSQEVLQLMARILAFTGTKRPCHQILPANFVLNVAEWVQSLRQSCFTQDGLISVLEPVRLNMTACQHS